MKRVVIESPFAPQTPLPEGDRCVSGRELDCAVVEQVGRATYGRDYSLRWCTWCYATKKRAYELARNARYLAACMRDSFQRGEAPFASHGLYTLPGVLQDDVPEERAQGIRAGFAWREVAHLTAFYLDLDWSGGMRFGEKDAQELITAQTERGLRLPAQGTIHSIEHRHLGPDWDR